MLKKHIIIITIFLLLLPLSSLSPAAENKGKEIRAIGVADGKSSRARDEALNDALRKAVEQGVGTFVTAELTVEQRKLVDERIYTESQGYIQRYEIVREGPQEDIYEVEIRALVKMGKLAGDLESIGLLIRKKQNPRVMVIIHSGEINTSFPGVALEGNRNAENQIESSLIGKGFQLIDAGQAGRKKQLETLLLKGDPSRAGKIAKDFGADILIEGDVRRTFVSRRQVFGRATRFFSNEIRIKAFETDTAKILFSGYKTRPPSGAAALMPLEEATSELTDEMIAGILKQWRKDVFQAGSYQLDISKISFTSLSKLKKNLLNVRGVQGVQVRSFHSGHALIEVKYQGPLEELADKIIALKRPRLKITGIQSNTIEIQFRK
ncbi:MAG: hypothetical protein SV375_11795 [Thermodesulfobacteriota bacterium]|nr:hypothetical protein [Thermodesulfobacteriota bacterium]